MAVDLSTKPKDEKSGLPIVEAPKGRDNAVIPESVSNSNFVDDFEVEQLPTQGEDTTIKETPKTEDKKTPPAGGNSELDEKTKPEEGETGETTEEESKLEEPAKEEVKDPLAGILKRPGQKVDEAGKATKTEEPLGLNKKVTRDYSGYSTEEVAALKGMSNEGFAYATKVLKENKELAKLKDTQYLQHEKAYTLSPEYNEIATTAKLATFEERYWKEQLIKMDAGQDCIPLQGYDNRTGQPVYGNPIKTSKALEEEVRQALYNASSTKNDVSRKLQEYPSKYKTTLQTDLSFLENYRKQQFGWATDPTMMDATIDVGGQDKSLKQIAEDVKCMIPAYMGSHPLAQLVADLAIAVRIQKAQLSQYETTVQTSKTKAAEADLVEPSSKSKVVNKGKGQKTHGMEFFEIDPALV